MADAEANILIRAIDKVTAPVRRINASVERMTRPLRRVRAAAARIGEAAGFGKLTAGLRGAAAAAGGLGSRLAGMLGPLAAIGGVASVAGLGSLVTDFAKGADETSKFSRQIGFSAEALQELEYAADRQGVAQQQFRDSLRVFSKTFGELKAQTGPLYGLLQKVNPEFGRMLAGAKSSEEAFSMMMTAMDKVEDPAKRAVLANAAFGESGLKMARLAEAGADGIAALREDARKLGLVIANDTASAAEGFVDSMTRWSSVIKGVGNSIGAFLMPQVEPLLQALTEWVLANRELIAAKISGVVERLAAAIKSIDWQAVLASIQAFIDRVQAVVAFIGGWENALIGLIVLMNGGLIGGILQVAAAFLKLGGILLANPVLAIVAAIAGAVYAIYANWDGIVTWFQGKLAAVAAAFDKGLMQGLTAMIAEFHPVRLVADAVNGLVQWLFNVDLYSVGGEFIGGLWDGIRATWSRLTAWLSEAVTGLVDWMPDWVKGKLGLDMTVQGAPVVPAGPDVSPVEQRSGTAAPGETRRITERVLQVTRQAAAPAALAGGVALALPAAAASSVPGSAVELPGVEVAAAGAAPAAGSSSAFYGGSPVTVNLTVNGQVEADAIRRTVEEAVRRALEDAREAQATDERASLYD